MFDLSFIVSDSLLTLIAKSGEVSAGHHTPFVITCQSSVSPFVFANTIAKRSAADTLVLAPMPGEALAHYASSQLAKHEPKTELNIFLRNEAAQFLAEVRRKGIKQIVILYPETFDKEGMLWYSSLVKELAKESAQKIGIVVLSDFEPTYIFKGAYSLLYRDDYWCFESSIVSDEEAIKFFDNAKAKEDRRPSSKFLELTKKIASEREATSTVFSKPPKKAMRASDLLQTLLKF